MWFGCLSGTLTQSGVAWLMARIFFVHGLLFRTNYISDQDKSQFCWVTGAVIVNMFGSAVLLEEGDCVAMGGGGVLCCDGRSVGGGGGGGLEFKRLMLGGNTTLSKGAGHLSI